jgi:hypothetical protein
LSEPLNVAGNLTAAPVVVVTLYGRAPAGAGEHVETRTPKSRVTPGESLLASLVPLLNGGFAAVDATIGECLGLITGALGGMLGEVWGGCDPLTTSLRYAATDRTQAASAFVARATELYPEYIPAFVAETLATGRVVEAKLAAHPTHPVGRSDLAQAIGLTGLTAFPIRTKRAVQGALVVFRGSRKPMGTGVVAGVSLACHQIGRYMERYAADRTRAMKIVELASTDPLMGLKSRRESILARELPPP